MDVSALMNLLTSEAPPTTKDTGKNLTFDPFDFNLSSVETSSAKARDIKDYITLSQTKDKQTVSLGGIELTIPETKPKLETVTPLQYMEASMKIMREMALKDGADLETVLRYAGYVIKIANMGQRFNWQSVLKYDAEYRKYQAIGKFDWGADNAWSMMVFLKEGFNTHEQNDINNGAQPRHRDNHRTKYDYKCGKPVCDKINGRRTCMPCVFS